MAAEKTQYIIVPVEGLEAAENDPKQAILRQNFTIRSGMKIEVPPIDLTDVDCVRFFYSGDDLTFGAGVTVEHAVCVFIAALGSSVNVTAGSGRPVA